MNWYIYWYFTIKYFFWDYLDMVEPEITLALCFSISHLLH